MKRLLLAAVMSVASLLAQSDDSRAWDILKAAMTDKAPVTRAKAAHALGVVRNDPVTQLAVEQLLADEDPGVRAAAAGALGEMQAKSAISKLATLLQDRDSDVVLATAGALRKLGDNKAFGVYYAVLTGRTKAGDSLVESQMKMLKDPKALARIGFEGGLGMVPFGGVGKVAFKAVTKDDISPVRAAAAQQLAYDPDAEAAKALVDALSDKKWIVRLGAAKAIGQRNDPALMPSLTPLFTDENESVRFAAAAAYLGLSVHGSKP